MSDRDDGFMAGLAANTLAIESLAARMQKEDDERVSNKLLDLLEYREEQIEDLKLENLGLLAKLRMMQADRNYSEDD